MYLSTVICPAAKLKNARLQVEREKLHIDVTTALVDGRRLPVDLTVREECRLGAHCYLIVSITTAAKMRELIPYSLFTAFTEY